MDEHGETVVETPEIRLIQPTAIEAINRSELVLMMEFAMRTPRSITDFKRTAHMQATENEEVAAKMFYSFRRGGKLIEGPTVRLAEIVGLAWRHLHSAARDLAVEEKVVRAQAISWDLQTNVRIGVEATRRITNKDGERYGDDMIAVTMAAARSVALRNSIFKVVPMTYVREIFEQCQLTAIGKALSMEQRRTRVMETFAKMGAPEDQVLHVAQRKSVADLTTDDIVMLHGLKTALQDGETTWQEILSEKATTVEEGVSLDDIANGTVEDHPDRRKKRK